MTSPTLQPHRSKVRRSRYVVASAAALTLLAGACSKGGDDTVAGTTSSSTEAASSATSSSSPSSASTTTGSSASTTLSASGGGCTSGSATMPTGAVSRQVLDVDGDGKADTAWISSDSSGVVDVGIVTAAGGATKRTWDSASPVTRSVLVIDVNDATPPVLLADDGRTVDLWVFDDCAIADVTNAQGSPYTFSLGFADIGTGVGCTTVDGRNQLAGLNASTSADGTTVEWTSTVVTITGTSAANGAVRGGAYTSPNDDAKIDLLHEVTCGPSTIAADGLTLAQ